MTTSKVSEGFFILVIGETIVTGAGRGPVHAHPCVMLRWVHPLLIERVRGGGPGRSGSISEIVATRCREQLIVPEAVIISCATAVTAALHQEYDKEAPDQACMECITTAYQQVGPQLQNLLLTNSDKDDHGKREVFVARIHETVGLLRDCD